MPETGDALRESLAALRLKRDEVATPRRTPRWLLPVGVAVLLVIVLVAYRVVARGVPEVQVANAAVLDPGTGREASVPILSGAGYVVSAERYVAIGVRVAGRIDRYFVEEGDHVRAGDPLVQLDARDYEAAVTRAVATLGHARAMAELKQKQLERARQLARTGIISRDELDVREAEAKTAAEAVRQAEAELAQARVSLDYTTLRAPTGGVILAKLKEVGEIAVPGGFAGSGDLIRMANLEDLRGQVDVTEGELAKVRLGQRAEVLPDAYPDRRYVAKVVKLYPQVDRQKGTLRVEVQIERPDDHLWPDMSARIIFLEPVQASDGRPAVLVPRSAVRADGGASYAWAVDDGHVRRVPLTLGADFGDQVQVTAGLSGTETLVVGDTPPLRDGAAVRVASGH
jgi:RND family efflux transporter MFP subunit